MASTKTGIVDEWLEDDKLMLLEAWARDGYTLQMIADRIGINVSTLLKWRENYPDIQEALSRGKEIIDYKVENALLKRALGFTTKEIKVTLGRQVKNGQTFQITKETTVKEVLPDVTACMAWLNNRRPDKWRRNRDKSIELEDEDNNVQITIVRGPKKDDEDDSTNREIRLGKKDPQSTLGETNANAAAQKAQDDKDYWPDDWKDED